MAAMLAVMPILRIAFGSQLEGLSHRHRAVKHALGWFSSLALVKGGRGG